MEETEGGEKKIIQDPVHGMDAFVVTVASPGLGPAQPVAEAEFVNQGQGLEVLGKNDVVEAVVNKAPVVSWRGEASDKGGSLEDVDLVPLCQQLSGELQAEEAGPDHGAFHVAKGSRSRTRLQWLRRQRRSQRWQVSSGPSWEGEA